MILIFAIWAGFLWRVRGGAWETLLRLAPGTTRARLATAALISAPLALGSPWGAVLMAPALFLGMALAGWGHAMDIGRVAGTRFGDAAWMSLWGLVTTLPAAIALAVIGGEAWLPAAAGALFGPIYTLAWYLPRLPAVPRFAAGPTEWAEFACGAVVGAALMVALP